MQRRWVVSPDYRSAIEVIVRVRKELKLTQREVGRRLGKHPSFLNKVEKFERRLDILEFVALARAYGLDPNALLDRVMAALPEKLDF
jgi:transcriptional regulator with XRE-family HTH domain